MSASYTITNIRPIAVDLLKVDFQFTPFDTPIVQTMYLPSILTDRQIQALIAPNLKVVIPAVSVLPVDSDSNVINTKKLIGTTDVATTA